MKGWPIAFYGFLDSPHFTEAGRLLMLASIMVHGEALDRVGGWRRPEFDALFRVGAGFPEFEASSRWEHHAMQRMLKTFRRQVYPDGAYDELSPHYHMVAINRFEGFAQFAEQAGRELPPDLGEGLEAMHTYYAGLIRPDGSMPQLNRGDRDRPTQLLLGAAERYDRPDWRYMATAGREGTRPADPPSRFFPWAGHLVSRDGWGEQALWSIFNAGPEGSRGVYADALHLSVSAFGKDFLLNSGRFWYRRDKWQRFARSSASSNVIHIDGRGQQIRTARADRPRPREHWAVTDTFDFARKTHRHFEGLEGEAAHTRAVVFLREIGAWVVVDRIATDRPRRITPMWHFHPDREVARRDEGQLVTTDAEGANLVVLPLGPVAWDVSLVRGREAPTVQGWYSEDYGKWEPNTVAEFNGRIEGDTVVAWLMVPHREGQAPPVSEAKLHVEGKTATIRATGREGQKVLLHIPLDSGPPRITLAP